MLQRNLPTPAGLMSDRARVRHRWLDGFGLNRDGGVAGEPVPPILEAGVQGLLDEKTAEARAVDEEIARQHCSRVQGERLDEAGFSIHLHRADLPFDPLHAVALGHPSEKSGVERSIDVICKIDLGAGRGCEAPVLRCQPLEAIFAELRVGAELAAAEPEVVELPEPGVLAVSSERVDVAIADLCPVLEQNAELERRGGGAHEFLLVDSQQLVEGAHRRNRRFADADSADLFRLHQCDIQQAAELPRKGCRRHPTRGAAARDHDLADISVIQDCRPSSRAVWYRYQVRLKMSQLRSRRKRFNEHVMS